MSITHQGRGRRRIAGRHLSKIVLTLAVAATAAAISAPGASASVPADGGTPCVYQTFETSNTHKSCVGALQVLLNDMHHAGLSGPDRILKTDGIYGNNTYNDVKATNTFCYQHDWGLCKGGSGYTTPATWKYVCGSLWAKGLYHGSTYYYVANCDVIYPPASNAPAPSGHGSPTLVNGSPPPSPGKPKETFGPTPGHHHETLGPVRRYVAMGDSFSSGQGASDYLQPAADRPGKCYRSRNAYSELLARKLTRRYQFGETPDFVACAGAQVPDLLQHQVKYLGPDVGLITVSVGGDDVGWSAVLRKCATNPVELPQGCRHIIDTAWNKAKNLLKQRLVSARGAYAAIRAKAPNATVIVVGYPELVADDLHSLGCTSVIDLGRGVRINFNNATDKLDDLIEGYAKRYGFRFVDPRDEFKDHGVCGRKADWIGGFPASQLPHLPHVPITAFHPNKSGQAGYADAIAKANPDIFG